MTARIWIGGFRICRYLHESSCSFMARSQGSLVTLILYTVDFRFIKPPSLVN